VPWFVAVTVLRTTGGSNMLKLLKFCYELRSIFGSKREEGSGENVIMRSLIIFTPHPLLWGDNIEKNEMGGACSMYEGGERCAQGFGGKP
jgi:hypothetical protein